MCGIVGLSHHKEAGKMAFLGLYALQHRGEEAAGIVCYDGKEMQVIKKDGLAVDNFACFALRLLAFRGCATSKRAGPGPGPGALPRSAIARDQVV